MIFPGFVGPSYTGQNYVADREALINLFVEQVESPNGKAQFTLLPTPGLLLKATLPQSPGRGILTQNSRTFAVAGIGAYELGGLPGTVTVTQLGSMSQDSNPATISTNGEAGHQVLFISGGFGYIYDLDSTDFSDVLTGATFGDYLDGYFLALDDGTATLKWSALLDGTDWDDLDVLQRETSGDKWIAMVVFERQILLLGSQTSDVYANTGDADNPFAIIDGASIQAGIRAPFSLQLLGGKPVWLGASTEGDGIVLMMREGYTPTRVSNHAVEFAIQGYDTITDAVAFTYQSQGHSFYVLNFPTEEKTWVYDDRLGPQLGWHERGEWDPDAMSYGAYRPQYHAFADGLHLVLDRESGAVYQMSDTIPFEADGAGIRRLRRSPFVWKENKFIRHQRVELIIEPGTAPLTGQGSDPQAMLRYSDDGGQTWSDERDASSGAIGNYSARLQWYRLGMGRNRIYEYTVSDPVLGLGRIVSAVIDVSVGSV